MDGPNVNLKFHCLLQDQIERKHSTTLLDVGSCALHVVHGAYRNSVAASGWELENIFSSLYRLFKDTPARHEDYTTSTGSSTFPLKFCAHRWIENKPVAERALAIRGSLQVYVNKVKANELKNPGTTSFRVVKDFCEDQLAVAKLTSFLSIAQEVTPFLTRYETDKPMLPFLAEDLFNLIRSLLLRFMKSQVLEGLTKQQLVRVDPTNEQDHLSYEKIDVGFAAEKELRALVSAKKASSLDVMNFRLKVKAFLLAVVTKLLEKAPLKYKLVRMMACLDPRQMVQATDVQVSRMKTILKCLDEAHRVPGGALACEEILRQWRSFLADKVAHCRGEFADFVPNSQESRVDVLLCRHLASERSYSALWMVVQDVLLLSDGQATVERGFSVNRNVETVNMHEKTVIAQRTTSA